ncbi:MAG: pfp 6-phosphofructokinase 1, partial [Planctomycetota bacterium]
MSSNGALGILAGGGPAPGINAVISAATIRARLEGIEVHGILDGFGRLMSGDANATRPLDIEDVARMHYRGGSMLGIARANPTRKEEDLERVITGLESRGIDKLVTIGGDDTAYSAFRVSQQAQGRIRVAHVPKTIDNDLDLPPEIDTFGYQTARSVGVDIVRNLMTDAKTTRRWYLVVAMGRTAGHLALGIGKAAGATLTVIPEEFGDRRIPISEVVDILAGAILKRLSDGRDDGVAVIAEGVALSIVEDDLGQLGPIERDAHGHVRLAEIDFGGGLKRLVRARLAELGVDITIVEKNIGYELRCADPVP